MFIKTRREPWHGAADAGRKRYGAHIHRDGAQSKPSSNKPIHNDKQRMKTNSVKGAPNSSL